MRRVFCRAGVIFALVAVLLVPASAFADDPQIQPPFPQAVSPATTHITFWQIVRIVFNV